MKPIQQPSSHETGSDDVGVGAGVAGGAVGAGVGATGVAVGAGGQGQAA